MKPQPRPRSSEDSWAFLARLTASVFSPRNAVMITSVFGLPETWENNRPSDRLAASSRPTPSWWALYSR